MSDWEPLLRPGVRRVGAYVPGTSASEMKARYGIGEMTRLNWNENLDGALPGVIEEAAAELAASWSYPDEAYEAFRDAVAAWAGVPAEQVVPGHGIQALTIALVSAFVEPGDAVVIPRPTYGLYAQACGVAAGGRPPRRHIAVAGSRPRGDRRHGPPPARQARLDLRSQQPDRDAPRAR